MGWNNYIIIPSLKIKIEISRHFKEDEELFNKIDSLRDSIELLQENESLNKKLKYLSLLDIGNILNCAKLTNDIDLEYSDISGLVMFLQRYGIEFTIISENDDEFNKYKDYRMIGINYKN